MAPMMRKPNPTAWLILRNSRLSAKIQTSCQSVLYHLAVLTTRHNFDKRDVRFVHRFTKSMPSLTKSLGISASSWKASDMATGPNWRVACKPAGVRRISVYLFFTLGVVYGLAVVRTSSASSSSMCILVHPPSLAYRKG